MDRMDKIIDFLLGKEDNCFSKFHDSLIKNRNRTWAEQLNMKAEEFKRGSGKSSSTVHALRNTCPVSILI